jgi:signal transduction histidine kinase
MSAASTTAPPVEPQASRFQQEYGVEALGMALVVANDVVGFDGHRIYLRFWDASDLMWSFSEGYYAEQELSEAREFSEQCDKRLLEEGRRFVQFQKEDSKSWIGLFRLSLPGRAEGYLAVRRRSGRFSTTERYHLRMAGALLQRALLDRADFALLRRLHLSFLDQKILLRNATLPQLCQRYLEKALYVCHGCPSEAVPNSSTPPATTPPKPWECRGTIRATVKVPTPNWMALKHEAHVSTSTEESRRNLSSYVYNLGPQDCPESIAAEVFGSRRTVRTLDYQNYPNKVRVYHDTECHLSAPIVAGRDRCRGVLSVETTEPDAYRDVHVAALTLLAAHLAWPLRQARGRSAIHEKIDRFSERVRQLRSETGLESLLGVLKDSLVDLGYGRGLLSKVDHQRREVVGTIAWGDEKMEAVREQTCRHFDRDRDDCQVLAVLTGKEVVIHQPRTDPRANKLAVQTGDLEPFGIFPLLDNHGRAIATIHAARFDGARIGQIDQRLIGDLCSRAMRSWEKDRRAQLERQWLVKLLERPFLSYLEMLTWFADHAVTEGFVARCRVFTIDEQGNQKPHHEGGGKKTPGFFDVKLDNRGDGHILDAVKPVLFVREGRETPLRTSEEFDVLTGMGEAHPKELDNERRGQWVETPVHLNGRKVAKLVLDHNDAREDAFTLGEMRLISRLTRTLSIAAEVIEAERARSRLCCLGLHASLLWHHLAHAVHRLALCPPDVDREELLRRNQASARALRRLGGLFQKKRPDAGLSAASFSIAEELREGRDILEPFFDTEFGHIRLAIDQGDYPELVPGADRPLLLILLSLVINAAGAIPKPREEGGVRKGRVDVALRRQPGRIVVQVVDNGVGIAAEREADVRARLERPAGFLSRGEGSGLIFASMLAQEKGWGLALPLRADPTTFELTIPTKAQGGGRMNRTTEGPAEVWVLDRDDGLRADLRAVVTQKCGTRPMEDFASHEAAREHLEELRAGGAPAALILITDFIGFAADEEGTTLVGRLRERWPLTMVILYSQQATGRPEEVERLRQKRLIHHFVEKGNNEELLGKLKEWIPKMEEGFAPRFRDYIAKRGAEARTKFIPNGNCKDDFLSLADLYAEIVLETELGNKSEKVWQRILDNPSRAEAG